MNEEFFNTLGSNILDLDGGNIEAKLWFCGIEPNIEVHENYVNEYQKKATQYFKNDFRIENFPIPYYESDISKWSVDSKIKTVISSWCGFDYQSNYNQDAPVFKLNLFPLPAPNVPSWNHFHKKITGCTLKSEYYGRCIGQRFPLLRELVLKYDPKVIVCIGREFINEFIYAFWGDNNFDKTSKSIPIRPNERHPQIHIHTKDGFPTLIETPFFGWKRFEIKKHDDLEVIGDYIRKYLLKYPNITVMK